jgi:hypothetical protein
MAQNTPRAIKRRRHSVPSVLLLEEECSGILNFVHRSIQVDSVLHPRMLAMRYAFVRRRLQPQWHLWIYNHSEAIISLISVSAPNIAGRRVAGLSPPTVVVTLSADGLVADLHHDTLKKLPGRNAIGHVGIPRRFERHSNVSLAVVALEACPSLTMGISSTPRSEAS